MTFVTHASSTIQSGQAGSQALLDSAERYGLYLASALEHSTDRTVQTSDNIGKLCSAIHRKP